MATDILERIRHKLIKGNNITIGLNPDTKAKADHQPYALSKGATHGIVLHNELCGYCAT